MAIATSGGDAEAHDATQHYFALPQRTEDDHRLDCVQDSLPATIRAFFEYWDRRIEGLRKSGVLEE